MSITSKRFYNFFLVILGPLALAFVVSYFVKMDSSLLKLKSFHSLFFISLILLQLLHLQILCLIQKAPLLKSNISLKFKEWFGLCVLGEFFNQILPAKSGSGLRMLYIHDKTGLKIREILSMSLAMCLIGFTLAGMLIYFFINIFKNTNNQLFPIYESLAFSLMFSGVILLLVQAFILKIRKRKNTYSPLKYLSDYKILLNLLFGWGFIFCLYPLKIYLAFNTLGISLLTYQVFELSLVLLLTSMVHIIPGNLGIKEVLIAYLASRYGISYEEALLICLLERFSLFIILFPMGLYYYWELFFDKSRIKTDFFRLKKWVQTSP